MKIEGLKVFQLKDWKPDSMFQADDGKTMQIPANQKIICQDENNDIVNVTVVTPSPLTLKVGDKISLVLSGNVSHTSFGWTAKGIIK